MFMKICPAGKIMRKRPNQKSLRLLPDLYAEHRIHLSSGRRQTKICLASDLFSHFRISHMSRTGPLFQTDAKLILFAEWNVI